MLLDASNLSKSIGAKHLFENVSFSIVPGEKVGLIGRNGNGKTTLLKMISAEDQDFQGQIITAKGTKVTLTKQEHADDNQQSSLAYILGNVPNYHQYKKILDDYEQGHSSNLDHYLETLERFTENRYTNLNEAILNTLAAFNIPHQSSLGPLELLSGGQKRYVEMVRMMFSQSDLLLIDEPTNHLDFLGKDIFISWMKNLKQTVIVVTHDRDVLKYVTKIIELKDKKLLTFKGNYDHYISHNASTTLSSVKQYSNQPNRKEQKLLMRLGSRSKSFLPLSPNP